MSCIAVMYHYVRPECPELPNLFYLHVDDFQRQLDFFEKQYGFVGKDEWKQFVSDPNLEPSGVLLTFDDGLIDHYSHVYRILKERGLWGIFYISTNSLNARKLLNVHRIHYLLGRYGSGEVLEMLLDGISSEMYIESFYENLQATPYEMQKNEHNSLEVKKIVNYALKPEYKDELLAKVFQRFNIQESELAEQFYLNTQQISEIVADGFTFGAHGASHNLLSKFDVQGLEHEVDNSIKFLNNVLGSRSDTFCYPYGGPDSWNRDVFSILKRNNIKYSFAVEPEEIKSSHMRDAALCLPRFDCNQFPYGQAWKK